MVLRSIFAFGLVFLSISEAFAGAGGGGGGNPFGLPEPATLGLFVAGAGAVVYLRNRLRK
jgi:PEP-CTERM motif-containing protein